MLTQREKQALDRHIIGNWGEDQLKGREAQMLMTKEGLFYHTECLPTAVEAVVTDGAPTGTQCNACFGFVNEEDTVDPDEEYDEGGSE